MKKLFGIRNIKKIVTVAMAFAMGLSLVGCGKEADTTTAAATTEASVSTTEATTEAVTEEAAGQSAPYYVAVDVSNRWESGDGLVGAQCDLLFYNNTNQDITEWTVKIQVPDHFRVDNLWNGQYTLENGVLTITNVDYNEVIAANSNIPIGFVMYASDVITADMITLSVKGESYANAEGGQAAEGTEAATETSTESATETSTAETAEEVADGSTPLATYGKLSVSGTQIVDQNGKAVQLKGVSTHGLSWFPQYVNKGAFQSLRDGWGVNLIRLALYTEEYNGYCSGGNKQKLEELIDQAVKDTKDLGMYVIIDWHILHDLTPKKYQSEAEDFFARMSEKYKDYDNVIYEICNEPNGGTTWSEVKEYAEDIIPIIRKNDNDAIVIVGTPNWSQDVDIASQDPITGHENIMYAVHFYAAAHKDNIRSKVRTAVNAGLPVFISEFSICDASGNGGIDYDSANTWMELAKELNLSYCGWNLSNKAETSSIISAGCIKTSDFTEEDLSESGKWLLHTIKGN